VIDRSAEGVFLQLVKLGIGTSSEASLPKYSNRDSIESHSKKQGLFAVVFDGVEQLPQTSRPPLTTWLSICQV
jgi:hypothetical protein